MTRATLARLAGAHGVATEYWDWRGRHVEVSDKALVAVLAALDVAAASEEAAAVALEAAELAPWRRTLPPSLVVRAGDAAWFPVHVDHGSPVTVEVLQEDGTLRRDVAQQDHWVDPRWVDGRQVGEATFALPPDLPPGWHLLRAHDGAGDLLAESPLAVAPRRLELPPELEGGQAWGLMAQLYAVRSRRSWGVGDLVDLADLAAWSGGDLGAGFVLVNPLHAGSPEPPVEDSPYLPVTRRFPSPLYLRVEAVPEYAYLPPADRAAVDRLGAALRRGGGRTALIDRDAALEARLRALELVHRVPLTPGRRAGFDAFRAREEPGLTDFATWCALVEAYGPPPDWPAALQDPRSADVAAARERHAERVEFHRWLQWLVDDQLAAAQRAATDVGMPVGVVHDLAVGVHPHGADVWAMPGLFAAGATVGAPPDAFNQQGQDWCQPPWRPDRLAETGYTAYRDLLRTVLRHAGGLRIDHVPGLFRLWWVPEGHGPQQGTYVHYDADAMLGVLVLEASRARAGRSCVVIGEDLGVVEPQVRQAMAERGILGTSVFWFEQGQQGEPAWPEWWRRLCLATVTTHDLPPTAGYLAGEHLRIRDELGLLERPLAEETADDEAERAARLALLTERSLATPDATTEDLVVGLHAFLARTPAVLVGVALPDVVGQLRPQNQPGTSREYPNWRVPLAGPDDRPVLLDDLPAQPLAGRVADVLQGGSG